METFKVRLNCIDHYQATPTEFDPPIPHGSSRTNQKERPKVSVIRVFGATETGQKVLMHIHGAFQYLYIEYSGSLVEEEVKTAIRTLQLSIDRALAESYRKKIEEGKYAYVAHISLVKGIPFYGFHVGYRFYLKIYVLNPLHMTRLADLLREGAVMKRVLQPYESHLQYLAQWMCDYNLYGCAYINCKKVKFRGPVPEFPELNTVLHRWHDRSIPSEFISDENVLPKQSHCSVEVDVHVEDILNRHDIQARALHHDFVERIDPLPADAKLVQSMACLWKDETRRRKARLGLTDSDSSPFSREVLVTMSADTRNSQAGGWIHEEEYRMKVAKLAEEEEEQSDGRKVDFDNFVKSVPSESTIKTALESVEDLYPENLPQIDLGPLDRDTLADSLMAQQTELVDEAWIAGVRNEASSEPEVEVSTCHGQLTDGAQSISILGSINRRTEKSETDVTPPISSSEFDELGIRKAGDLSHVSEDAFAIPDEFLVPSNESDRPKRNNPGVLSSSEEPKRKKRRVLVDEMHLLPDVDLDSNLPLGEVETSANANIGLSSNFQQRPAEDGVFKQRPDSQSSSQQTGSQPNGNLRDSKLMFPIVKDPNDTNTIMRLSQQSNTAMKLSQELQNASAISASTSQHTSSKKSQSSSQKTPIPAISSHLLPVLQAIPRNISASGSNVKTMVFRGVCPSFSEVQTTMCKEGLPDIIYQSAYYSDETDVPDRQREYAGREFKLESNTIPYLPEFDATGMSPATYGRKPPVLLDEAQEEKADRKRRRLCKIAQWNLADQPPTKAEVTAWLEHETWLGMTLGKNNEKANNDTKILSQIDGPTQKNKHGFKYSQKYASTSVQHETQYMSIMSLEVHVNTRGNLAPNPAEDEIACVFWCVQSDDVDFDTNAAQEDRHTGILVNGKAWQIAKNISRDVPVEVEAEPTELDVLTRLTDIVRQYDPDILTGYEVHNSSWGYLIERARVKYELNLCDEMSRMKSQSYGRFGKEDDRWGFNQTSTIRVTGRHTINIWRAMRGELNLLQYTMENVVFHLLRRRIPHYKFADLTTWYRSKIPRDLSKVIEYFVSRVQIDLEILESNELVPRTSEQARLLGVDWFSVPHVPYREA